MKKFFKILWKGILFSVCVVVLIVGVMFIRAWIQDQNQHWTDMCLSANIDVLWYYKKDEYRIYDNVKHKVVEKGIDRVVLPADGDSLTVFFRNGLRGYLNANTGKVVIPEQYHRAWVFSEGLAAVVNESGKIGFINKDNEVVVPFVNTYNSERAVDYLFEGGFCMMTDDEGKSGFAALENVMYLFSNAETYLSVGIARAIFAVPGHFCFGILMGYYYSLAKFYPKSVTKNKVLVLIAPIIAHGLYDSILFILDVTPAVSGILVIVFLVFCHKMWKYGSKKIKEHLERDNDRNDQYDCSI